MMVLVTVSIVHVHYCVVWWQPDILEKNQVAVFINIKNTILFTDKNPLYFRIEGIFF